MKLNRIAAAATVATIAAVSVCGLGRDGALAAMRSHVSDSANARTVAAKPDPTLAWLISPGGQAQVQFNQDVATLAGDLQIESHSPTVANHLVFEADARVMRAQAKKILSHRALLPAHNRAAYKRMLNDFIVVANLLQPGPGYGTTAQDYAAWYKAMRASNIIVW
jgi:hypothetical protein